MEDRIQRMKELVSVLREAGKAYYQESRDLEQAAEHMAANALYQIEVDHVPAVVFDGGMVRGLLG